MLELRTHGHTIFLERGGTALAGLSREWREAQRAYLGHLRDVDQMGMRRRLQLTPIFDGARIVGVAAIHRTKGWVSFFLLPGARGLGLGERLVEIVNDRQLIVGAHARCGVVGFYESRGFKNAGEQDGVTLLLPPTLRTDVRKSAVVRIKSARTGRMLLLHRSDSCRVNPGDRCFPGGGIDGAETPWQAAVREAFEETGIDLSAYPEPESVVYYTGSNGYANQMTCFMAVLMDEPVVIIQRKEIQGSDWYLPGETKELPMGRVTRLLTHIA